MSDADISIVVQGPIKIVSDRNGFSTDCVLEAMRAQFPRAEIIYSGWYGSELPKQISNNCNHIVLSKDPGALQIGVCGNRGILENTNRQIVSTLAGFQRATRKWLLKCRSDVPFFSPKILEVAEVLRPGVLFRRQVAIAQQFTRLFFYEYGGVRPCCGHISDLLFFGLAEDVRNYWEGALIEPSMANIANTDAKPTAEQILFLRFWNRVMKTQYVPYDKFANDMPGLRHSDYARILNNDFLILSASQWGAILPYRFKRYGFSRFVFASNASVRVASGRGNCGERAFVISLRNIVRFEYMLRRTVKRIRARICEF